jgi:hypothetical protein
VRRSADLLGVERKDAGPKEMQRIFEGRGRSDSAATAGEMRTSIAQQPPR